MADWRAVLCCAVLCRVSCVVPGGYLMIGARGDRKPASSPMVDTSKAKSSWSDVV